MIELFRQAQRARSRSTIRLPIRNEFHSIVDGSAYQLSVGDDSDAEVYTAVGKTMTLRQLCEAMITVSSNFAANLLIEKLGVGEHPARRSTRLGADGMQVLRGVEDQKAFDKGLNNTTTARGLLVLLEKLATGRRSSPQADAEMIEILKRQKFNDAIPAGLPAGTRRRPQDRHHHPDPSRRRRRLRPRPYVLVVLVRRHGGPEAERRADVPPVPPGFYRDSALTF